MKKLLISLLLLCCIQLAHAWRALPVNMDLAVLKHYQQQQVVLTPDGFSWLKFFTLGWLDRAKNFSLAPGVRVRDENNRFITYDQLALHQGKLVAVKRDGGNLVDEIWILNTQEMNQFRQLAKQREDIQ